MQTSTNYHQLVRRLLCLAFLATTLHLNAQTQARKAYDFYHSIGVNTHEWYDWNRAKPYLIDLGIKHIRDIRPPAAHIQDLYNNHGVKLTYCIGHGAETVDFNFVRSYLTECGPEKFDAVTGRNEIDLFDKNDNKFERARADQQNLWNLVKNTDAFRNIPVATCSIGFPWSGDASRVGNLTAYADYGDIHHYFGGTFPEASTDFNTSLHRDMIGNLPVLCTESGYHNLASQHDGHKGTSETAEAKYVARQYLFKWMTHFRGNNWFARTFDYELLDEDREGQEGKFGWVRLDGSKKPAYHSMKNFISVISDQSGNFTPASLNYAFSGDLSNIQHLLLQKSDGKFLLIVWQGISCWNQDTGEEWTNPNRNLSLTFNGVTAGMIKSYVPLTSAAVQQTWSNVSSISNLSVPDHPLILEITLGASGSTDSTDPLTGTITARDQNGTDESAGKAFDNNSATKWLNFIDGTGSNGALPSWIQYAYASGEKYIVTSYTLTSANDAPERDPKDFRLYGVRDDNTWQLLDTRTNVSFSARFQKQTFSISNTTAYKGYRLEITAVNNAPVTANSVQLAEIELLGTKAGLVGKAINAGGGATGNFLADTDFSPAPGNSFTTTEAVVTTGVSGAAPGQAYQSCRWGNAFSYTLSGLTPGASCQVRLHFAELTFPGSGQRKFNVSINGSSVLTGFDVVAEAGGRLKALVKSFPATATASGTLTVSFTQASPVADNPMVSAIEAVASSPARQMATAPVVESLAMQLSPNPAKEAVRVKLAAQKTQSVMLRLCNTQGQRVSEHARQLQAGENTLSLSLQHIPSGFYLLTVTLDGRRLVKKLIVE